MNAATTPKEWPTVQDWTDGVHRHRKTPIHCSLSVIAILLACEVRSRRWPEEGAVPVPFCSIRWRRLRKSMISDKVQRWSSVDWRIRRTTISRPSSARPIDPKIHYSSSQCFRRFRLPGTEHSLHERLSNLVSLRLLRCSSADHGHMEAQVSVRDLSLERFGDGRSNLSRLGVLDDVVAESLLPHARPMPHNK